jgi:hypothetical protein
MGDDLLELLGNARVVFWMCPRYGEHWPTRDDRKGRQTVEWRDEVAYCLFPGCGICSTDGIVCCDLCSKVGQGAPDRVHSVFVCMDCRICPVCAQGEARCYDGDEVHCEVVEALSGDWKPSERLLLNNALYRAAVTWVIQATYYGLHGLDQRVRRHGEG